ncbi:MAG: hypothetical protein K6E17_03895 [Clostridiales bacterium]|nr:hypothetical protein [Clostridiales bacterium]
MKRIVCLLGVLVLALGIGCAAAEQRVNLPDSKYSLALPDSMEYRDGREGSDENFSYLDRNSALTAHFSHRTSGNTTLKEVAEKLRDAGYDIQMTRVNGLEMIVYRAESTTGDGMKAIGYILKDGNDIWETWFWYATQNEADMTKTIMESIQETGTV